MTWLNFVPDRIHYWGSEIVELATAKDRQRLRVVIELDIDADDATPFAGFMRVFSQQWLVWHALHDAARMPPQEIRDER